MLKDKETSRSTNGFTLVEILMVVFLFGLIMTLSGALFSAVLKGSSKSEITKEVKQIGDYAMGQMERAIRNAKSIDSCSTNSLTIVDRNGIYNTFSCQTIDLGSGSLVASLASSSAALKTITPTPVRLSGNNVTLSQSQGACGVNTLSFDCSKITLKPPQVTIIFSLYQKGNSTRPEEQASVNFQSTISLRTY